MNLLFICICLILFILVALYALTLLLSHTPRPVNISETFYVSAQLDTNNTKTSTNPGSDKHRINDGQAARLGKSRPLKLSDLNADPTLELSVVVPCYNETSRLAIMLEESIPVLQENFGKSWEVLLVDDGSKDGSAEFAIQWALDHELREDQLKVCSLVKNRGKGGAVTHGMKFFKGKYVIFADADGASKFSDALKLLEAVKADKGPSIAIGSRAHMVNTEAVVKRSFIRNFLMYGLHALVFVFGIRSIGDTQCGFKLFTREAAKQIFPYIHTEGWIFDVEVLLVASKKNIPIHEVPISWHEVEGSKIDLARDSIKMAIDLVIMRVAYIVGIYNETRQTTSIKV